MNTVEVESINNVMLIKIIAERCATGAFWDPFIDFHFCLSKDKYTDITTVVFLTLQLSLNGYSASVHICRKRKRNKKKTLTEFLLSIQPRMEMKLLIFAKERKPLALK